MAEQQLIRVGFIGAGSIAESRHLPGLIDIDGVQLVAVANRSMESSRKIAKAWGFAEAMEDWKALVARDDIDVIFIGTWPYMHREMSVAALNAGKHVFCQARMAMDLPDAQLMLEAAKAHPHLVNMICPPPTRMPFEPYIKNLLAQGGLGQIVGVQLSSINGQNLDTSKIHWREDIQYSGRQIMAVGILAETLNAWVGPYDTLHALTDIPIRRKKNNQGQDVDIHVPQIVHIQGRLRGGVPVQEFHTGVAQDPDTHGVKLVIHGMDASLRYTFGKTIELAQGGHAFKKVSVPAKLKRDWHVEEDFIAAVRNAQQGKAWKVSPDFEEGMLYMRKMQAIYESARSGQVVKPADLPTQTNPQPGSSS